MSFPRPCIAARMTAMSPASMSAKMSVPYQSPASASHCPAASSSAAALDAVRAALTSDDPAVMRAMAERVGLTVETREWVDRELTWDGGWTVIRRYERARVCGPWREVPNAD